MKACQVRRTLIKGLMDFDTVYIRSSQLVEKYGEAGAKMILALHEYINDMAKDYVESEGVVKAMRHKI